MKQAVIQASVISNNAKPTTHMCVWNQEAKTADFTMLYYVTEFRRENTVLLGLTQNHLATIFNCIQLITWPWSEFIMLIQRKDCSLENWESLYNPWVPTLIVSETAHMCWRDWITSTCTLWIHLHSYDEKITQHQLFHMTQVEKCWHYQFPGKSNFRFSFLGSWTSNLDGWQSSDTNRFRSQESDKGSNPAIRVWKADPTVGTCMIDDWFYELGLPISTMANYWDRQV